MQKTKQESFEKLKELIEGIDFCMLTTVDSGQLRSRPMSTQEFDNLGDLWFFTSEDTHKVDEITEDNRVNVSYSQPAKDRYVSVSGSAEIVKDRSKMEELWSPILKAWFPEGLADPKLCLLRVSVENAEYWDSPAGKLVEIFGFVKALATGQEAGYGDNEKISF